MSDATRPARSVEIHPAYRYDCDECGRESFVRARVVEAATLAPEDLAELVGMGLGELDGVELEADGQFLTCPDSVTCPHCGTEFEVDEP